MTREQEKELRSTNLWLVGLGSSAVLIIAPSYRLNWWAGMVATVIVLAVLLYMGSGIITHFLETVDEQRRLLKEEQCYSCKDWNCWEQPRNPETHSKVYVEAPSCYLVFYNDYSTRVVLVPIPRILPVQYGDFLFRWGHKATGCLEYQLPGDGVRGIWREAKREQGVRYPECFFVATDSLHEALSFYAHLSVADRVAKAAFMDQIVGTTHMIVL